MVVGWCQIWFPKIIIPSFLDWIRVQAQFLKPHKSWGLVLIQIALKPQVSGLVLIPNCLEATSCNLVCNTLKLHCQLYDSQLENLPTLVIIKSKNHPRLLWTQHVDSVGCNGFHLQKYILMTISMMAVVQCGRKRREKFLLCPTKIGSGFHEQGFHSRESYPVLLMC